MELIHLCPECRSFFCNFLPLGRRRSFILFLYECYQSCPVQVNASPRIPERNDLLMFLNLESINQPGCDPYSSIEVQLRLHWISLDLAPRDNWTIMNERLSGGSHA